MGTVVWRFLAYAVLIVFALIAVAPVSIMWISAFKTTAEVMHDPFGLPVVIRLGNLIKAWTTGHFSTYMVNTIIVTVPTVLLVVSMSAMAGYAFGRLKFFGSKALFYFFLIGLMVPFQSIMIPMYFDLQKLNLLGTFWAMILPAAALGLPFGIFLLQAFFRDLPGELADSARIDGCAEFSVFFRIMLPMAGPAVSGLIIFQSMWTWNAFLMPLLFLNQESLRTLALGLMFFSGRYTTDFGLVTAAVTLSTIPLIAVYVLFQRRFLTGMTAGAVKG